ncbi:testis-expressed protein 26-like [Hypanus sabinus]|uniref:testis-expressed protein 26-like n=1 Tax=Hypanus sabinus TaxID=79690 RepID=UPI0028C4AD99|nr:testis-expressed protein 26-like [Hypanus sabinus]XP_059820081.1 testis-expressed protein 26-like [Hypanus sabinus]XP_059820083.1 testis-expressed protein 26-like [Hypanus sabinus]
MELCLASYAGEAPHFKSTRNAGTQGHHCPNQLQGTEEEGNDRTGKKNEQALNPRKAEVGIKIKKRKKEKMANITSSMSDPCSGRSSAFDPYQTTFKRDFVYRPGSMTQPIRPKSSNGFTYPYQLHEPIGDTSYSNDYAWKLLSSPHGSRGSSGSEPYPCDVLWLWKQLKKNPESFPRVNSYFPQPMSSDDTSRLKAHQYDTIYRQDYLGLQQELTKKCPPCVPIQGMGGRCLPLTDSQHHYRKPNQKPELAACTSRYGSNKQWNIAAKGIVPKLTQSHMKIQENSMQPTTYEREYGSAEREVLLQILNK